MTRRQILVIDDDDDVRDAMAQLLSEEGFDVLTAANGEQAVQELDSGAKPAAIVLDLMMPMMSGWDFWDWLQASAHARVSVIVLTATGLTEGSIGHARVLPKPIGALELIAAVEAACAPHPN